MSARECVFGLAFRVQIISKMSTVLAASAENCARANYSRLKIAYARVNSIRERSHTDSARFVCASAATRTCGRAGARTVIYVLIHTSRHAQFAYVEGVYSAKKTERRASVWVMCARAEEWKRIRREVGTRRRVRT